MNEYNGIISTTLDKILSEHCTKEVVDDSEKCIFPYKLWDEMKNIGMSTMSIPEEDGGSGFSYKDALGAFKIIGKYSAPIPLAETLISNWILYKYKLRFYNNILTLASPLDYKNISIQQKGENQWYVDGMIGNIPYLRYSEKVILFGKTNGGKIMLFIVDTKEISVEPGENMAGEARDIACCKNTIVNTEYVVEIDKKDIYWIYNLLALMKVSLSVGAIENIFELTIDFANLREQFGRKIGKFQAIKQQVARMASEVVLTNIAVDYAIESFNSDLEFGTEIMAAKTSIGSTIGIATSIAHQVHAAIGFTEEHPLQHSTRRLWSWRDEYGSENEWAKRIGQRVLEQSESNVWEFITS